MSYTFSNDICCLWVLISPSFYCPDWTIVLCNTQGWWGREKSDIKVLLPQFGYQPALLTHPMSEGSWSKWTPAVPYTIQSFSYLATTLWSDPNNILCKVQSENQHRINWNLHKAPVSWHSSKREERGLTVSWSALGRPQKLSSDSLLPNPGLSAFEGMFPGMRGCSPWQGPVRRVEQWKASLCFAAGYFFPWIKEHIMPNPKTAGPVSELQMRGVIGMSQDQKSGDSLRCCFIAKSPPTYSLELGSPTGVFWIRVLPRQNIHL